MYEVSVLNQVRFDRSLLLSLAQTLSQEEGTCLLFSGGDFTDTEQSFLCLFPYETISVQRNLLIHACGKVKRVLTQEDRWAALKSALEGMNGLSGFPEWVGYLGYELANPQKQATHDYPDAVFLRPGVIIAVDHSQDIATLLVKEEAESHFTPKQKEWISQLKDQKRWPALRATLLSQKTDQSGPSLSIKNVSNHQKAFISRMEKAFPQIQETHLKLLSLSHQFEVEGNQDPFEVFYRLVTRHAVPFAAYLHLSHFTLMTHSAERFLSKKGNFLEMTPVTGITARGSHIQEDQYNKDTLIASEKRSSHLLAALEQAGHDLSLVSQYGSVRITLPMHVETTAYAHYLKARIQSEALPGLHPIDLIRTCFPTASAVGTPKACAMRSIAHLEHDSRGVFTGSIGYLTGNGNFDFNVCNQSLSFMKEGIAYHINQPVNPQSTPKQLYQLTLKTSQSVLQLF